MDEVEALRERVDILEQALLIACENDEYGAARLVRMAQTVLAGHSNAEITRKTGVTTQNIWWIAEDRAWREDPDAPRQPVYPERDCAWCETPVPHERGRRALYCSLECKGRAARARCAK